MGCDKSAMLKFGIKRKDWEREMGCGGGWVKGWVGVGSRAGWGWEGHVAGDCRGELCNKMSYTVFSFRIKFEQ